MDRERERIQADLRGVVRGEVRCDDLAALMYASDASIYQVRPAAVVRPASAADVSACVRYAAENDLPLHARGAGTGLAGESLGAGIVLDFSHTMRRILHLGPETVRVQPGVVLAELNRRLAPLGRHFAPDPSMRAVTTLGSVAALDASGSHWPRWGSARDYVESLQVVLASGTIAEAGKRRVTEEPPAAPSGAPAVSALLGDGGGAGDPSATAGELDALVRRLAGVIERNRPLFAAHRPRSLVNRCGYHLFDVLEQGELNLARLLVGSEGTLALFTELTLRTTPLPRERCVALAFFDRLDNAARAAQAAAARGVSACDLLDRRILSIARETDVRYDLLLPRDVEAMLLLELQGDEDGLPQRMEDLLAELLAARWAIECRVAADAEERNFFWRLARRMAPILYRLRGSVRPLPFVEDVAVPPAELPEFLARVQGVLQEHQVTASLFAHAAHGQIHLRPLLDLASSQDVRRMQDLAGRLYEEVLALGGTISGEHGAGLSRTWFLRRQWGPLYDAFRDVKRIFDPQNLLNPGKVVAEAPQPLTKNLRPVTPRAAPAAEAPSSGDAPPAAADPAAAAALLPLLHLSWREETADHAARVCNGCGRCRTQADDERMCPIFRLAPAEEASPRAKANLVRAILTGRLDPQAAAGDAFKEVADLCVNCHQCRLECPANVDIPKLMIEAKAQHVAVNGLTLADALLGRLDRVAAWASRFPRLTNAALRNRFCRWLLERTVGIAQGRKLPPVAHRSFLRLAQRRRWTRPAETSGRKVAYFVDVAANWFDVELAEAFAAVLERNGVALWVPPDQRPSGMALLTQGAVERARPLVAANVALLADAVRQGYQIVATEPAAALCLQQHYPQVIDDDDARLVAANTSDAGAYLWRLHQAGALDLRLQPLPTTVYYHQPCHLRAMQVGEPGLRLLELIPELQVRRADRGCSGMAGTYGLKRSHYRSSLRLGWGLISAMREPWAAAGATECSACRMQMEQGVDKPTRHPVKYLARAYGIGGDGDGEALNAER